MSAKTMPTDAEKADAVMRLMDAFDAAHSALSDGRKVLAEGRERGASRATGPLFPFIGEKLVHYIDEARSTLWKAREIAAVQYLDSIRAVDRDSAGSQTNGEQHPAALPPDGQR